MSHAGNSALIHMERARAWVVHCPPGMLADGKTARPFSSLDAFDGYVRRVRQAGMVVEFSTPFAAHIHPSKNNNTEACA